MDVAILIFDGFDELDAIGPFEVFQHASRHDKDLSTRLVTTDPVEMVEAQNGLRIEPDDVLGASEPDLVVVPGGGWYDGGAGVRTEYDRGTIPDALVGLADDGVRIASVCTGALLLSKAGLLEGRPATTHHTALEDLRERGADVRETRFVDDGDVLTSGGITAGFDLALHLVEQECGPDVASTVARELEYERAI